MLFVPKVPVGDRAPAMPPLGTQTNKPDRNRQKRSELNVFGDQTISIAHSGSQPGKRSSTSLAWRQPTEAGNANDTPIILTPD